MTAPPLRIVLGSPAEFPVAKWLVEEMDGEIDVDYMWAAAVGRAAAHFDGAVSTETIARVADKLRDVQEELRKVPVSEVPYGQAVLAAVVREEAA